MSAVLLALVGILSLMGVIVLAGMIYGLYQRAAANTDPLDYTDE